MTRSTLQAAFALCSFAMGNSTATADENAAPRSRDPRVVIEPFAAAPDIVHPIGATFDRRGRLLVIESHTHFPPDGYQGLPHDRIRAVEDTDGDGRADRFSTFYEGTKKTMDVATAPDGTIYIATRSRILSVRDTTGDGRADQEQAVVTLKTKGDYPHNGLSGLAFDFSGNLFFGLGENLGAAYALVGSDGTTIRDEGEGGNVFWCTAGGRSLRRAATGFWNPFGVCLDIYGRVFAVDNDPDASPPCRLLHVVEGGDYGYQFRYGRSGRHPFQSWNGRLPFTLPMTAGTGEAPCEVVSYESNGLPNEYRGDLLVASWAEHRVERYRLKRQGASFVGERLPFIEGGNDFRPVGIAVAPDGSLYITDWVLRDYKLHGRGAIWHVRLRKASEEQAREQAPSLDSPDRRLREAAARKFIAQGDEGRTMLRAKCSSQDPRVRAVALAALIHADDRQVDLAEIAANDAEPGLRAMAVRAMVERDEDTAKFLNATHPAEVRLAAIAGLCNRDDAKNLLRLAAGDDPFVRSAAVRQLALLSEALVSLEPAQLDDPLQRIALLLALRAGNSKLAQLRLAEFLDDADPRVRFTAAKWIADARLADYRPTLAAGLRDAKLNLALIYAYATALARLDNRPAGDRRLADYFLARVLDAELDASDRITALKMVPSDHKNLKLEHLGKLLESKDAKLRLAGIEAFLDHSDPRRFAVFAEVAQDSAQPVELRAAATAGLAPAADDHLPILLALLADKAARPLRIEALRALAGTELSKQQQARLSGFSKGDAPAANLAARVLGKSFATSRPTANQLDAWLARLEGPADAEAGRRIFFHPKLAVCYRCHRCDGRGRDVGPELSTIGRSGRRKIVESIIDPSAQIAPQFQSWAIQTDDGISHSGMLMRTHLDDQTYVDTNGQAFQVNTKDIVARKALRTSIMPNGLINTLTDQELRDLAAFLESRR